MTAFLKGFFLTVFLGYGGLVLLNALIDPVDILGISPLPYEGVPNPRFHKIEYLKQHHDRYDTYLFGSSRIGMINPKTVETHLPGSRVYNMTCNSCNQYEYLHHLKFMLQQGFEIKTLFLQVDLSDIDHYAVRQDDFTARIHPETIGENQLLFYLDYLTTLSFTLMKEKIQNNLKHKLPELLSDGMDDTSEKEAAIQADAEGFYKQAFNGRLKIPQIAMTPVGIQRETRDALREFIQLCRENQIQLHVFTTPHHHRFLLAYHPDDYYGLLTYLSSLTTFTDFSGINRVTHESRNYYEKNHYRVHVGDWIVQSLLTSDRYFGKDVTPESLSGVIAERDVALKAFLTEKNLPLPNSWAASPSVKPGS